VANTRSASDVIYKQFTVYPFSVDMMVMCLSSSTNVEGGSPTPPTNYSLIQMWTNPQTLSFQTFKVAGARI